MHDGPSMYDNNENMGEFICPVQAGVLTHFGANLQWFLDDFFSLPVGAWFHQDVFHT